jgi:signal transduction histidine kinase/CheY-like chemotaxis protein
MRSALRNAGIGLLAVVGAILLRRLLLGALGTQVLWVTFFPAVVIASLYGGWLTGLAVMAGSCLTALYAWAWLGDQPFVTGPSDQVGLIVFLIYCVVILVVAQLARRAQAKANQAREQAEAANRAKSVFLATIGHELRSPLNAILGFSGLLRYDPAVVATHRQELEIIDQSGQQVLGVIHNVLDMAKIEAGRSVAENAAFDLYAMMEGIAGSMRPRADAKGLTLTWKIAGSVPRVVVADEGKLRQVVLNLVDNAVKFTAQGGVSLRLACNPNAATGHVLLDIQVEDSGEGIDSGDQQRIFERFVQLGNSSAVSGTGLGLAVVREYVELMGGAIGVESEAGRGSVFRIRLPVELAALGKVPSAGGREVRLPRLVPGQPAYRMLIVEDEPESWQLLSRLLETVGFQVRVAGDGAEGVEAFTSWQPAFIWMDWRMPVMDGLEATRRIRALEGGRDVKIVVISGSALKEEREEVLAAGVDDFIAKPIEFDRIYDCLTHQLGVQFAPPEPLLTASPASPSRRSASRSSASRRSAKRAAPTSLNASPSESPPQQAQGLADTDLQGAAALPRSLRTDLANALVSLDATLISTAIAHVAELDPALGHALDSEACQLRYTSILRAVQPGGSAEWGKENRV